MMVLIWQSKDQALYLFIALAIKAQTKVSVPYFACSLLSAPVTHPFGLTQPAVPNSSEI
jgi:hypothetical protein